MFNRVKEFMLKFGHKVESYPTFPDEKTVNLRLELINEEFNELKEAVVNKDLTEIADALGDILVVTLGAGAAFGIDLDAVFTEIHRSNMSKLGADGNPIYREDGKIMKGPNYSPPDIKSVILNQKCLNLPSQVPSCVRFEALTDMHRPSIFY